MVDKKYLNELQQEFFLKVDELEMNNKKSIKQFKIEQAEMIKNVIIDSDNLGDLQEKFTNFQNELVRLESEGYNLIKDSLKQVSLEYTQRILEVVLDGNITSAAPTIEKTSEPVQPELALDRPNIIEDLEKEDKFNSTTDGLLNSVSRLEAMDHDKTKDDIPVETKELDDWISEIKNLI